MALSHRGPVNCEPRRGVAISRRLPLSADEGARRLAFVRERALRDEVSLLEWSERILTADRVEEIFQPA